MFGGWPGLEGRGRGRGDLARDLAFSALLSATFLAVLLVVGPINIEQYFHSHPAVRVFQRTLFEGRVLLWSSSFGFGTPLPLGENLALHPLFLLEPLISLRWVFRLFWWIHLTLGGFCLLRVCRRLAIDPRVAGVVTLAFLASPTTANYTYRDDWPSIFLGWAFFPVVLLLTLRVADSGSGKAWIPSGALLSLVLAFMLWSSHLGYVVAWVLPLAVFVVVRSGASLRVLTRFAAVVVVAAGVASERLLLLWQEGWLFPAAVEKWTQPPLIWAQWLHQLHWPFDGEVLRALATGQLVVAVRSSMALMTGLRGPFLGLVFSGAALAGVVTALRRAETVERDRWNRPLVLALVLAFLVSVLASMTPALPVLKATSSMWFYRDPAFLFGVLLAGIALTRARQLLRARLVGALLVLQAAQVVLVALPPMFWLAQNRHRGVHFYQGERAGELAEWIRVATAGKSARVFLSPAVGEGLMDEEKDFAELGLLSTGDLEPLGLLPVNGYFKNVSMDSVYPSFKLMGGRIGADAELVEASKNLDVLSVEYLLALASEKNLDLSGFEATAVDLSLSNGDRLRLLHNPDAWPLANLFEPSIRAVDLGSGAVCELPGLLCRDLSPLASLGLESTVSLHREEDRFEVRFVPAEEPRVLLTSFLYRPEWRAVSDLGPLPTEPIAGALLSVDVPPGVAEIRFVYSPRLRRILFFSGVSGALVLVVLALRGSGGGRRPSPEYRTDGTRLEKDDTIHLHEGKGRRQAATTTQTTASTVSSKKDVVN